MLEQDAEMLAIIGTATTLACCLEAAALLLEGRDKTQRKRSCWVKPPTDSLSDGDDDGDTRHLFQEHNLFEDPVSCLYMDEKCFHTILNLIKKDISKQDTILRKSIPCEQKLTATLRYLATGDTSKCISSKTNVSISYLSPAIMETCDAIYNRMNEQYLQYPTKKRFEEIANSFEEWTQFPNCIGALGTKHIQFNARKELSKLYLNKQGYHSLVLFAVADTFGRFLLVDVGSKGHLTDDEVLEHSKLKIVLNNTDKFLPKPVIMDNGKIMPYVFVADSEFPCSENILTPYQTDITIEKEIYNEKLLQAVDGIRKAFSVLTSRFGVLRYKVMRDHVKTANLIKTCCVLHNFLIENSPRYMENITLDETIPTMEINFDSSTVTPEGEQIRKLFKEYLFRKNERTDDY